MARAREFDKETVLEKAMCLFRRRGYEATSVQEITEATGLSRSSLYDTFGGKNALYMASLDHYIRFGEKGVHDVLADGGSKREAIKTVLDNIVEEIVANPQVGCFAVDATTELAAHQEDVNTVVSRSITRNTEALVAAIRTGQRQGDIRTTNDPRAIAEFLMNTIQGLRVTGKTTHDRRVLENIVNLALSVLDGA